MAIPRPLFFVLPLIGILIVVAGFALRLNPLLVVAVVWLALPVIGLLERVGLKERARIVISSIHVATTGRLLLAYLALRQITAALGLTSLGGHAQMVRPLVAPMAEAAAEAKWGEPGEKVRRRIRAHSAAVDNIGVFFGEDIFIAIGSILLIRSFLDQSGYRVEPSQLAVWAIPTALCAFVIHGIRLLLLDRSLRAEIAREREVAE